MDQRDLDWKLLTSLALMHGLKNHMPPGSQRLAIFCHFSEIKQRIDVTEVHLHHLISRISQIPGRMIVDIGNGSIGIDLEDRDLGLIQGKLGLGHRQFRFPERCDVRIGSRNAHG